MSSSSCSHLLGRTLLTLNAVVTEEMLVAGMTDSSEAMIALRRGT